ncbi:MAG: hypothetical protein AAF547_16980 [Actinomycetota bacterium]
MEARPATPGDLDAIVELTRRYRRRLAEWCPVYFNPRHGADEGHALWLEVLITAPDHETVVLADDGHVVGFANLIGWSDRTWVDDLCVDDDGRWSQTIPWLADLSRPWITCVAVGDVARSAALAAVGAEPATTYFACSLPPVDAAPNPSSPIADFEPWPVAHTFAEAPFLPTAPGALVVSDGAGGYAVGSAGANPPIYDPGGSTCVVDTIRGADRSGLLQRAMGQAAARGDGQMVVTCGAADEALRAILVDAGFEPQVDVFGRRP